MDKKFLSSWPNLQFVPESFVHPPEKRPGKLLVAQTCKTIPVLDLQGHDHTQIVQHIMKSTKEFGFFQVCFFSSLCFLSSSQKIKGKIF